MCVEMNTLLRYFAIAILVVAAVLVLAVCGEGAGACAHAICGGADRPSPLSRVLRRMAGACASAASAALTFVALATRGFRPMLAEFVPVPALLRASSLRI